MAVWPKTCGACQFIAGIFRNKLAGPGASRASKIYAAIFGRKNKKTEKENWLPDKKGKYKEIYRISRIRKINTVLYYRAKKEVKNALF